MLKKHDKTFPRHIYNKKFNKHIVSSDNDMNTQNLSKFQAITDLI